MAIEFAGNAFIAHFHVNWLSPVKVRQTLISGDKKMLVWDDLSPDEKLKIYDRCVDVKSIWRMEELVERLVRWSIHPERLITHRFTLDQAPDAYALMASGACGKVAMVFDEEAA